MVVKAKPATLMAEPCVEDANRAASQVGGLNTAGSLKEHLVLAAERLFASNGLQGVSLRQIGAEAGSANTSAVHYHFGSKDDLVQAILMHRLPHLQQRREILKQLAPPHDLRSMLEAHLLPIFEQAQMPDSFYLTFIEQFIGVSIDADPLASLPPAYSEPHERFRARVSAELGHLPVPIRSIRIKDAVAMCLHITAARERALRAGAVVQPLSLLVAQTLDSLVGMLQAPMSEATAIALKESEK